MINIQTKSASHSSGLGLRVGNRRADIGLTLSQVAEASGLSVPYISRIERGEGNPTLAALQGLAEALGLPMVELFEDLSDLGLVNTGSDQSMRRDAGVSATTTTGEATAGPGAPGSPVRAWMRVTRDDILEWANTSGADRELPELIRGLIAETTPAGTQIHFPAGTGIRSGGPDGEVECDAPHPYVPLGRSVWELSIAKNANRKAKTDYDKRCETISDEVRAETAYVAVNARAWTGARDFKESRSAAVDFREVRALNVDDLAAWLERALETTVWFRERIGKPVVGVEPIDKYWGRWLGSTRVPLDTGVVLAGREESAADLRRRCSAGGMVTVGGDIPRDELLVFVAAALAESGQHHEALYVEDVDAASRLLAPPAGRSPGEQAFTMVVESADAAKRLTPSAPRCVIVPVPGRSDADIKVGPLNSVKVSEQLEKYESTHGDAWNLAHLGRRSLLALRRRLALKPEMHQPPWADPPDRVLRRCLMMNRWDRSSDSDVETVQRFVGKPHEAIEEQLEQLRDVDPPLMRAGSLWYAVSPTDAWLVMGSQLQHDDLAEFADLAVEVLGEPDPLVGLDQEEIWTAALDGTGPRHSERIKKSMAATLAVLATTHLQVPPRTRHVVDGAVDRLLSSANSDPTLKSWASVLPCLSLLAEASPEAVLRAVRSRLAQPSNGFTALFTNNEAAERRHFGFSPESHLLWALDVLAWSPDHLRDATDLLAELAALDISNRLDKAPMHYLQDIFCPWLPNTSASLDERFAVLDEMRRRHSEVASQLMLSMLSSHQAKTDGFTPRYRDWKEHRKPVTRGEYADIQAEVSTRLLADAEREPQRYESLIARCGDMPPQPRAELLQHLRCTAASDDEAARCAIWPALRKMVARHREFSDTNWALPPDEIAAFESLVPKLQPKSFVELYAWLFESWVPFVDGVSLQHDDHAAREAAVRSRRVSAVATMFASGGIEVVDRFAGSVEAPEHVWVALAGVQGAEDIDIQMLPRFDSSDDAVVRAASGYFAARFLTGRWDLFDSLMTRSGISPVATAELLRASRDAAGAWERVDAASSDVHDEYWARFTRWDLGAGDSLASEAARRLNRAGHPPKAVTLLASCEFSHGDDPVFAQSAAETLEQIVDLDDRGQVGDHAVASLLAVLNRHVNTLGERRVAEIEWNWLPELGWSTKTPCLSGAIADDPEFFAQVAEIVYRSEICAGVDESADERELDEREAKVSSAAYGLLHKWDQAPGLDTEGNIDAGLLRYWTTQARTRLTEVGRPKQGDIAIGAALAAAPAASDGQWPAPEVCDLIEEITSDEIDSGFSTTVFNSRGVVSGSVWEGGKQDRELAAHYKRVSRQLKPKWYRTAEIFSRLADHYDYSAIEADDRVESRLLGL